MTALEAPRFERSFEPVFESASQARSFAREAAEALGRGDAADRVEMLVGELAANAILHAQTSYTVALNLTQGDLVRVEVWDGNPDLPRRKPAIGDDVLIHGRGMALIEALADRWGVVGREEGKCVWVELGPQTTTITLAEQPTRDLLAMIQHLDDVIRELSLIAGGARSGTASATVPEYVLIAMDRVRPILYGQKEAISRQAATAWRAGEPTVEVEVELPASAGASLREVLEVFEVLDDVAGGDRAMLLPATRPEVARFRRQFFTQLADELDGGPGSEPAVEASSEILHPVQTPVRTLVVDDSADVRYLLSTVLGRDRSFQIVGEAADGRAAIEEAERLHPDLVVLDRQMPVLGGLEAIPLIRERCPAAEIVLYTAAVEPDTKEAAAAAGAIGVLDKAGISTGVAQELTRLLARRRPHVEAVEVHVGPVASSAARVWVANTRHLLKALRLRPELIGGAIRESVMDMFERFLDTWTSVATDTDVFFWTGRANPGDVREIIEQWARIDAMDDDTLAALGCRWSPPEGQPFFAALTAGVVEALTVGHQEALALAQRLGGDWSARRANDEESASSSRP